MTAPAGRVLFYHLTEGPVEALLPILLGKSLEAGLWVDLRGRDAGRLDWLDEKLWLGAEDAFLPHGRAGGPHDALQPVLLTTSETARQEAACLMAVDGAEVRAEEAARMQRTCILFDGHDPAALERARGQWRSLTQSGVIADYWAQVDGRWTRKMTTEKTD